MAEYELVRVSREMVDRLIADESDPAVIAGIDRHDDGTCELLFRTTDLVAENHRLRGALSRAGASLSEGHHHGAMAEIRLALAMRTTGRTP